MRLIDTKDPNLQRKWLNKFARAYHGKKVDPYSYCLCPDDTYLVGYANYREVGYISLRKLAGVFASVCPTGKVLKCAFVEENRRGRGALRQMIQLAADRYEIKMIEIERDRFEQNRAYYAELGFTEFETKPNDTLGYCYSADFSILLRRARMTASCILANDNSRRMVALPIAA